MIGYCVAIIKYFSRLHTDLMDLRHKTYRGNASLGVWQEKLDLLFRISLSLIELHASLGHVKPTR